MGRRRDTDITNFLRDITDDIKNFAEGDAFDRGHDGERGSRRTGGDLPRDGHAEARTGGRGPSVDSHDAQLDELRQAVAALSARVGQLSQDAAGAAKT